MGREESTRRDDGWRERLARWEAPEAPPLLEARLRGAFRRRRRSRRWSAWGARAAVVLLTVSAALAVRWGGAPARPPAAHTLREVSVVMSAAEVRTDLDLRGFVPIRKPRITRLSEVVSEAALDGFQPVRTMTVSRLN